MPLIRNGSWDHDEYTTLADQEPLLEGPVLVSLTRFHNARELLLTRNLPLGVRLTSAQSPEEIGPGLHQLTLVALEFPIFRDGRGFSWARLLRGRLGFQGEIRAVGHFLIDQLAFMERCGINAFDGDARITPQALAAARVEFSNVYQPAVDGRPYIGRLRANARSAPAGT
jgi:uncharacterized protein (DUF934 family)